VCEDLLSKLEFALYTQPSDKKAQLIQLKHALEQSVAAFFKLDTSIKKSALATSEMLLAYKTFLEG
jgi:hypothetical protein